jgi:hypothetical protein
MVRYCQTCNYGAVSGELLSCGDSVKQFTLNGDKGLGQIPPPPKSNDLNSPKDSVNPGQIPPPPKSNDAFSPKGGGDSGQHLTDTKGNNSILSINP